MKPYKGIFYIINNLTLLVILIITVYLALYTNDVFYSITFLFTSLMLAYNIQLITVGKHELFISIYIVVTNIIFLIFQSGINSPVRTDYYYISLFLASMALTTGMNSWLRFWAIGISVITFLVVCFTNSTPKLELNIYNPAHYKNLSYLNLLLASVISTSILYSMLARANKYSKQLSLAIEKNEAHRLLLNSITENIDTGICRTNATLDRVVYVNQAQLKLFGYNEEEFKSINPYSVYSDPATRTEILRELDQKGFISNKEVLYKRKDGTTFWGLLSSRKVIAADGSVMYDGVIRDISELKKVKEELQHAKNEAERISLAKSKFVSVMSHEIRNPLSAMLGIIDLLLKDKDRKHEDIAHLNMLNSVANNLLQLLNESLDFSKIEAGKITLREKNTDLNELIEELSDLFIEQANIKKLYLNFNIYRQLPNVWVDAVRLNQVLINLISNAIKFTNEGGVTCSIELLHETDKDVHLKFSVADTGPGISESKKESIFKAFEQIHQSAIAEGAGLGLAISQKIIEQMGSKIQLQSEEGKGSTFYFELKLKKSEDVNPTFNQPLKAYDLKGKRVLLVEDNTINIFVTKQILERWGAIIKVAENGNQAIELCADNDFDVILLDLHMPGMSGFETARTLRVKGIGTPIIALTADALAETRNACISAGMNDYLTKPFNPNELQEKIFMHTQVAA